MADGFVRFELADGEVVELDDDDVGPVYRGLWSCRSEEASLSTATLLSHEVQLPQADRRTIELTQPESGALWDAMTRQRVVSRL